MIWLQITNDSDTGRPSGQSTISSVGALVTLGSSEIYLDLFERYRLRLGVSGNASRRNNYDAIGTLEGHMRVVGDCLLYSMLSKK